LNAESIIDALGSHLEALRSVANWGVLLALAVWWASVRQQDEIELGPLKVRRSDAMPIAAAGYFLANVGVLVLFARIDSLLRLLPDDSFVEGYSKLATGSWLMNPYAMLGPGFVAQISCAASIGLLICSWWACFSSLALMTPNRSFARAVVWWAPGLSYLFGLASLGLLYRTYLLNKERLGRLAPTLMQDFHVTAIWRWVGIGVGMVAGFVVFVFAWRWRRKYQSDGRESVQVRSAG